MKVWQKVVKFFHHLFDPHCRTCADEVVERNRCKNCELYREQLDIVIRERDKFLDIIVEKVRPRESIAEVEKNYEPVKGFKPWRQKQRELEQRERESANSIRAKAAQPDSDSDIEKLEDLVLNGEL